MESRDEVLARLRAEIGQLRKAEQEWAPEREILRRAAACERRRFWFRPRFRESPAHSEQDAGAQEAEGGSAVHLSLDGLDAVDVTFDDA